MSKVVCQYPSLETSVNSLKARLNILSAVAATYEVATFLNLEVY